MHTYEIQKFGRKHLVSISSGLANPWQTGITVTGFNDGYRYRLTWYDPWTGNSLGTTSFTGTTVIASVPSPGYTRDIIAIIKPEEGN
jgi:hypothetical protein